MPTNRKPISRAVRYRLSFWEKLSLEYGEADHRPGFRDDAKRRAAWLRHRHWMLARCRDGRRPQAYWDYEAPVREPDYSYKPAALWEAGVLTPEERVELEAGWRRYFEEAQAPGFTYCGGPNEILHGPTAKRAHYKWAGIPRELIRRWSAVRRRRDKTIRELAAPSPI